MSAELSVKVKDSERKLQKDFLLYAPFMFQESDPIVHECVQEVLEEFKGEPETIEVKATMVIL